MDRYRDRNRRDDRYDRRQAPRRSPPRYDRDQPRPRSRDRPRSPPRDRRGSSPDRRRESRDQRSPERGRSDRSSPRDSTPKGASTVYENVVQPRSGKDKDDRSRRGDTYRDGRPSKPKPDRAAGSVAVVTKADSQVTYGTTMFDDESMAGRTDIDDRTKRRGDRDSVLSKSTRQPGKGRVGKEKGQGCCAPRRRRIAFGVVLALLIVGAAIGVTVYFVLKKAKSASTPMSKYDGGVASFYDKVCKLEENGRPNLPECIVASLPSTDTCESGDYCTKFEYNSTMVDVAYVFEDVSTKRRKPLPKASDLPFPCRIREGENEKWGVCSETGKCDRYYEKGQEISSYADGTWEDNCDEINPCWFDSSRLIFDKNRGEGAVTRQQCLDEDTSRCGQLVDAIVYLQHLRCRVDNRRITAAPCQGLPLKLRLCKQCQGILSPVTIQCNDTGYPVFTKKGCKRGCAPNDPLFPPRFWELLPDGAKCEHSSGKDAYCYWGTCFVIDDDPTPLMTAEDCKTKKTESEPVTVTS